MPIDILYTANIMKDDVMGAVWVPRSWLIITSKDTYRRNALRRRQVQGSAVVTHEQFGLR